MAKKDAKKTLSKKRKILIIVGVVVLVLLAAGAGVALRWWQDTANRGSDTPQSQAEEQATLPGVVDNLQNLRTGGDDEAFDQELATALEDADYDDPTKALLYIQQGNAAYDRQDFNAALEAFLQAEELDPSSQTAQLLAFTYEELGDKEKAIEHYRLTIERLSPESMLYEADKAYFEERINRLQG